MEAVFEISDIEIMKQCILEFSRKYTYSSILDSNNYSEDKYSRYELVAGIGAKSIVISSNWKDLDALVKKKSWLFGFLSYDLKNNLEELISENEDGLGFAELCFFEPEILLKIKEGKLFIDCENPKEIFSVLVGLKFNSVNWDSSSIEVKSKISKEKYLKNVLQLQNHIQVGDIFEVNFCQEFFAEQIDIDPFTLYNKLKLNSPTPFGCFLKLGDKFCMGSSPERFIQKNGSNLISQPIKGTAKRENDLIIDEEIKRSLRSNNKEKSENVMIVDLVRNDLSKIALDGSVKVEELCELYSFPQVHQMISTISCKVDEDSPLELIKPCFPMGSMTGAPKVRAMELIEQYESSKRGVYSGAVGYITPNGDFDFNVLIRSFLYNVNRQYLSFSVGGAITHKSDPQKEYDESLLKAKGLLKTLGQT